MSTQPTFISGLSDPRLTRFYDPIMKWVFWEEFIRRSVVDAVQAAPGHTIIDVGCGTGTLTISLETSLVRGFSTLLTGLDSKRKPCQQCGRAPLQAQEGNLYYRFRLPQGFVVIEHNSAHRSRRHNSISD